jgi:hypothetical protein
MGERSSELLMGDILSSDGLHDVGASDEHLRAPLDHEDKICYRWAVNGATGTAPHDHRHLGHHPRSGNITPENSSVIVERHHSLLHTGTAPVVDADEGDAEGQGEILDFPYLLASHLSQGAPDHCKILRKYTDFSAIYCPETGNDAIGVGTLLHRGDLSAAARQHVKL